MAIFALVTVGAACSRSPGGSNATTRAPAHAPHQLAPTPAQAAHQLAQTMLGAAVLPVGARPYRGALPLTLTTAGAGTPSVANLVDEYRAWMVQVPAASLRSFQFATTKRGFAYQGGAGSVETPTGKAWIFESQFLHLPLNVALAQVNVAVADHAGGGAVVRVDALVSWTPPKPEAEYVPVDDRVATLTAMHPSSPPAVFRRVVITDPHRFAALAASFNRMRLAVIVITGECGASLVFVPDLGGYARGYGTIYEVAFSTDTRTKPNLIVVLPTCHGIGVRAGGALEPTLLEDDTFPNAVRQAFTPHA